MKVEIGISYECKLCKSFFTDRLKARNHIKKVHNFERKLLNMNRNRLSKRVGLMGLIKRSSDWVNVK